MIPFKEKDELIVVARKQSNDPLQEQLRQQKQVWNAAASSLISKIIAFKRALNGRQDPRFNLPVTKIQNPFPTQIGEFLDKLSEEYTQLITGAEAIISSQESYSQHRRLPKPKLLEQTPSNDQTAPQQQAAADDGLVSEAGILDFFRKTPQLEAANNLKKTIVNARNRAQDIQNYLSSMDPTDIAKALIEVYTYQDAFNYMTGFIEELCQAKGLEFTTKPEKPIKETKEPKQQKEVVDISFLEKVNNELPYIDVVFELIKKNLDAAGKKLYSSLTGNLKKAFSGRKSATQTIVDSAKEHYEKLFKLALSTVSAPEDIGSFSALSEYLSTKSEEPKLETPKEPSKEDIPKADVTEATSDFEFVKMIQNELQAIMGVVLLIKEKKKKGEINSEDADLFGAAVKDLRNITILKLTKLDKDAMAKQLKSGRNSYKIALIIASKIFGKPNATSFADFDNDIKTIFENSADLENDQLMKLAHNMFSRYLKKKLLEGRPLFWNKKKNEMRQYRIWTIDSFIKVEKTLNDFLSSSNEKDINPDQLLVHFINFASDLASAVENLLPLVGAYVGMARLEFLQKERGQDIQHRNLNMGDVQQVRAFMNYLRNLADNARLVNRSE